MTNREIANSWFDAFNQHDLENLLALYDEHAEHYSPKLKANHPETNGLIKGKAQLRKWWAESFEKLPSLKYVPQIIISDGNKVFFEYIRKVDGQDDMTVGELLEIEHGVIIKSKVYHG